MEYRILLLCAVLIVSVAITVQAYRKIKRTKRFYDEVLGNEKSSVINRNWFVSLFLGLLCVLLGCFTDKVISVTFLLVGAFLLVVNLIVTPLIYEFDCEKLAFVFCLRKNNEVKYEDIKLIKLETDYIDGLKTQNYAIFTEEKLKGVNVFKKKGSIIRTSKTMKLLSKHCSQVFPE